ncbi:MAG: hypothetical protein D6826_03225, partial [Alphaproteobacteria bacterium]
MLLGVRVPHLTLDPQTPSAAAKIRAAVRVRHEAAQTGDDDPLALSTFPAGTRPGTDEERPARPRDGVPRGTPRRVVLVTGLSGAGHSTALKILEDMGYEAIDNLPLNHLDAVLSDAEDDRPIAVGIDIRTRRFTAATVMGELDRLAARSCLSVTLVFVAILLVLLLALLIVVPQLESQISTL